MSRCCRCTLLYRDDPRFCAFATVGRGRNGVKRRELVGVESQSRGDIVISDTSYPPRIAKAQRVRYGDQLGADMGCSHENGAIQQQRV